MAWDLDSDRPVYIQLVERIQMQIVSGDYPPGGKLPSVRDLAAEAAVNPNTMQKAFAELERGELIVTQRTNGRTVTENVEMIENARHEMARRRLEEFTAGMKQLGYTREQILALIKEGSYE